jgi:glycerophosphoryl diester phosphodiesterase
MLHETLHIRKTPVTLIHHAANCGHSEPSTSLAALKRCLEACAHKIEIDVIPLADASFALLHDPNLEADTSGKGNAIRMRRSEIENLYYMKDGEKTSEKVGFLEGAVDLLAQHPNTKWLQLDLKPYTPLTRGVLKEFTTIIEPVMDRIQVTSVADWAVRALSKFAPDLALGYDPLLYLDIVDDEPRPDTIPPFRVGAYGLLDDHPLSAYQWGPLGDYFAARAGALFAQVPAGCEWFIRAEILKMSCDAGFNWIDFLHQNGSRIDGWTIDVSQPEQIKLAQFLVEHDIDELTTDTPSKLAGFLHSDTII